MYTKCWIMFTAKHRVYLSILLLSAYVAIFNYYIWEMAHGMNEHHYKLLYNYLTVASISIYVLDRELGTVNFMHKQFNLLLILCVIINYVLIILARHGVIYEHWKQMFWCFNSAVLITTIMICTCIYRHDYYE